MDKQIHLLAVGGIDNMKVVDCSPRSPARNEIRVRHAAIGVNYIDIYMRTGLYQLPLPGVLGVEGAGIVEAVGPDITHIAVGDRVAYAGTPGGYAATRLLPAWRAIRLPDDIPLRTIAGSLLRGLTAHMLLTRTYPAGSGSVLLVHAAAGGLGSTLTRWARHLGCTVLGTAGTPEKAALARAHGADHVIIGRDADIVSEVHRLTDGRGVDFAIDGIGGSMLQKTLGCVRKFGMVASVGQAGGPIPALSVEELGPKRTLSLSRPSVMAYAAEQETYAVAAHAVIAAIRQGLVQGAHHDYALTDAARAHQDLELGRTTGSLILLP